MTSGGKPVRAHPGVISLLVNRLTEGRQPHNHVARLYVVTVNDVGLLYTHEKCRVSDDSLHQITDVSRLSAGHRYIDPVPTEHFRELRVTVDDSADSLSVHPVSVAPDGVRQYKTLCSADAEQIVEVHDDRILRDIIKRRIIPGLAVLYIGERGLCTRPVRVHCRAVILVAARVLDKLAERARENSLVLLRYGAVHLVFCRGNAA